MSVSTISRLRCQESVRNWDSLFPIGTMVEYQGRKCKTESHAGAGDRWTPSVFIEGVEAPVPISSLTVPGYKLTNGRKRK